jgi:hypothetical protein
MIQARIPVISIHSAVSPYRESTAYPDDLNASKQLSKPLVCLNEDEDGIEGLVSGFGVADKVF